ncbi:TetR/AcrR family transcriptional regulator [Streptococcus sobrinus]|mgnify:CR=1 FL=1|uniref:Transcriptional regulator, TetR family n=4 Tax=Streptococcus sobrinus TaxID=1310 RepID=U2JDI2_9STRE|nr:TetR/AcrR family transcriptional regulator [Streptococcus sobrinus]AWN18084.1 TetR/AcrR family transcriptional regulator [Streptococcus sobrinus]AWN19989.1 TetR/AcrR family transcriptional regulator [Streptococcus sobrinus]AWN60844.1 TetR/AcrR family transcriptional regulator [Streptococcus sobrinus]AWN62716.1 TetR/AcrR family transcriptional regulator [Streptococcus sobrinus]EMP72802.1 putative transcriptional regulator [Streptococcus sobrinus DSM 20742 = ATCC 33478]
MPQNIIKDYLQILAEEKMPPGKKRALATAIELFASQGFDGTSTLQIAAQAGVSQATIFKYFKTKEDLLLAILEPVIPKIKDEFFSNLLAYEKLQEAVHFLVQDRWTFIKANAPLLKILMQQFLTNQNFKMEFLKNFQGLEDLEVLQKIKLSDPNFRKDLPLASLIRRMVGPLLTYFYQTQVLGLVSQEEARDLADIEEEILRNLTK